jgi:hypothetical protein
MEIRNLLRHSSGADQPEGHGAGAVVPQPPVALVGLIVPLFGADDFPLFHPSARMVFLG